MLVNGPSPPDDGGKLSISILAAALASTIMPASVDDDPAIRTIYADILRRMADVIESQTLDNALMDICGAFLKAYMEVLKRRERERLGM